MIAKIKKSIPKPILVLLRPIKTFLYDNPRKLIIALMLFLPYLSNLISLITNAKFIRKKIIWLDKVEIEKTFQNEKKILIYSPDYGSGSKEIELVLPKINMYLLQEVYGSTNSSSFYNKDFLYLERLQGRDDNHSNYSSGHLVTHNTSNGLVREKECTRIDKCILFLGGNGSFNYFHWIIEILPKLLFINSNIIKKYGIEAIFVNKKVIDISNFKIALDLIIKNLELEVIYADQVATLQFKKVFYITTFNHVLYNSKTNQITMNDNYLDKELLISFRKLILSTDSFTQLETRKEYPKKLFLLRGNVGNHNKRDYNEKEIYTYLQSKGYIGVKVEEYSFLEQVFLFNNADYIIGPSGAFWTNLIFCKAGVKAISWLPKKVSEFSVYSTIANYFGVEMKFIFSKSLDGNLHGRYSISISDLLKTLDSEHVSV